MSRKSTDRKRGPSSTADADTASYEHAQGRRTESHPNTRYPKMPHERDESARPGAPADQPSANRIEQAQQDVESGQVDTDRRGVPDDVPTRDRRS
jgi:hypothetical protein